MDTQFVRTRDAAIQVRIVPEIHAGATEGSLKGQEWCLVFKSPVLGPQKDRRPNWTGPKKDRTAVAVQALW